MALGSSLMLGTIEGSSLRLVATAVAVPALASHLRPVLALTGQQTQDLATAAGAADVRRNGRFLLNPTGVQVWSGPYDGASGQPGSAVHLGSVDWRLDGGSHAGAAVHRCIVTAAGQKAGQTPAATLAAVLALIGLAVPPERLTPAVPPPRDPFRRAALLPSD
jgi:hypothetical protein